MRHWRRLCRWRRVPPILVRICLWICGQKPLAFLPQQPSHPFCGRDAWPSCQKILPCVLGKAQRFVELRAVFHRDYPVLRVPILRCFLASFHFVEIPLRKEFVSVEEQLLHIHRPRRMVCYGLVLERWSCSPIKLQAVCRSSPFCD